MDNTIKAVFLHYLQQLQGIVENIPNELFNVALYKEMPSLEFNAKVAADFALRGYCPLIKQDVKAYFSEESGKAVVQKQIVATISYLEALPDIKSLDASRMISEKAGFAEVNLSEQLFLNQYILPNFYFHISIVYAIAVANGVELGKADFDGIHVYPKDFTLE